MKITKIDPPKNWQQLPIHDKAQSVPLGKGADIKTMAEYMKRVGYRDYSPIWIWNGYIIDGRHRLAAAMLAGIVPVFAQIEATEKEVDDFMFEKICRCHYDKGTMALYAASISNASTGRPKKGSELISKSEAAKKVDVSRSEVQRASKVLKKGTDSVRQLVTDGVVSVSDAASISNEKPEIQDQAAEAVQMGRAETLKDAVVDQTIWCPRCAREGKQIEGCGMCERAKERAKTVAKRPRLFKSSEYEDDFKNPIPKHLKDVWADPWIREMYDYLCLTLEDFRMQMLTRTVDTKGKKYPFFKCNDLTGAFGNVDLSIDLAIQHIKEMRPAGVCPSCDGNKCSECRNSGLVPRKVYEKLLAHKEQK